MNQYTTKINDYLENSACKILQACLLKSSYIFQRNNMTSNDIDLKVLDSQNKMLCTIDVQYSMNYAKYGDVRIDLMSAGRLIENTGREIWKLNKDIKESNEPYHYFKYLFIINKSGKYFEKQAKNMLGVFYYFYNGSFDKNIDNFKAHKADFVFFLPTRVVLQELENSAHVVIKINDKKKNGINENHHSAFICLNINEISKNYDIPIFQNKDYFSKHFPTLFQKELDIFLGNNYD